MFFLELSNLLEEFAKLGIYLLFCIFLSSILFFASLIVSTNKSDSQKESMYECGFEPYEDARNIFDVRFYLVAILFLVFDLEAIFFFPWCVTYPVLTNKGFFFMIDFIFELLVGYIYAWQIGALDWD